jgi:uncharacterized protein YndB with AHSA1/START domain
MPSYDIRVRSAAPREKVFALVADATSWPRWAGPLVRHGSWAREGEPAPGGVGAVRRLGTKRLGSREEILEYDPPHYLAYTVLGRVPFREYRAIVSIDRDGSGSRITWAGAFEPAIPGTGRVLNWMLRRLMGSMASGLARHAESTTESASS